jgi:hypothetical protein
MNNMIVQLNKKVEALGHYVLHVHFLNPKTQRTGKAIVQKKPTENTMNKGAEVPYWPVNNTENTRSITLKVSPQKNE